MASTGSDATKLIVIRGNSGSGKSTIARTIRERWGKRGLAIVGQDNLRREILKIGDDPANPSIGLIDLTARYALDHGYHVIVEGILGSRNHGEMLVRLVADHIGTSTCWYLDIPFEETLRRHAERSAAKPATNEFGENEMRGWYKERDLVQGMNETVIPESSSLEDSVDLIFRESGLVAVKGHPLVDD
jgi:predicted kinase